MLDINMSDVISVLNQVKPHLIALGICAVLALAAVILCVRVKDRATKFMIRAQSGIAFFAALVLIVNLICFGPMHALLSLATGEGSISDESVQDATLLCEQIAEEGIVLLKNEQDTLPLSDVTALNVFGWASTNPVYGGTGSGALSDAYHTVTLLEGLQNAGFQLNTEISKFYTTYCNARPEVGMNAQNWTLPEPAVSAYPEDLISSAKTFSDTALIVIARSGGENADLPTDMTGIVNGERAKMTYDDALNQGNDWNEGDTYLNLTNREAELVEMVCSNFSNVVVVYNGANTFELGWVDNYSQIKGVVYCPGTGQSGFNALGSVLSGKVDPSGKTTDTFVYDLTQTPTFNNFGEFQYENMEEYELDSERDGHIVPSFVHYVESIYVGYRFYETAAAEGLIDYDKTVQYPFGYGLSYTTFDQEITDSSNDGTNITLTVKVTNTGDLAGKDVVQVYYNPPYTNGGIEKSVANLVEFAKTSMLEPGASEDVTITFPIEQMASYDYLGHGCYVLEKGDYTISINSDAHHQTDSFTYTVDSDIVYDEGNPRSTDQIAAVNQFDDAAGDVTYLSRADGFANYAEATAAPSHTLSQKYKDAFLCNANYDPTQDNNSDDAMPVTGAKNGMTLAQLRGAAYDDPQWDTLLDQLTLDDMNNMIALGGYQTLAANSVGKIATVDCDGPASINNNFTSKSSIGFPSAVMIACTWNVDLAERFGDLIGKMADEMNVSGWYAPAMNLHRSAFAGRNFEYYSEDGVLSGIMASKAVQGAQEHGVYAYIKHFALNDQETARSNMLCTWSNEQAMRELYLKPFEIAVKDGGAGAVMTSFNYIGVRWSAGTPALCKTVLREEWGFRGFVITDYFGPMHYMNADLAIRSGNDIMLVAYPTEHNFVKDQSSATGVQAMRTACHNIMYTVVNSRSYNEENMNPSMENWVKAAIVVDVLCAAAAIGLEVLIMKGYRKRKAD